MAGWTNVAKPSESSVTSSAFIGGQPIGLLLALTQTTVISSTSVISGWSSVSKPSISSWTSVAKPTTQTWISVAKPTN